MELADKQLFVVSSDGVNNVERMFVGSVILESLENDAPLAGKRKWMENIPTSLPAWVKAAYSARR